MMKAEGYVLPQTEEFQRRLEGLFARLRGRAGENFGNAGTVGGVVEETKANIGNRVLQLADPTEDDFRQVLDSDLPAE